MQNFPRNWPFVRGIHRYQVNSPHKGQWRGALMFSLICVWINGWINNREAGDLRRHRGHYDVNVMKLGMNLKVIQLFRWYLNFPIGVAEGCLQRTIVVILTTVLYISFVFDLFLNCISSCKNITQSLILLPFGHRIQIPWPENIELDTRIIGISRMDQKIWNKEDSFIFGGGHFEKMKYDRYQGLIAACTPSKIDNYDLP